MAKPGAPYPPQKQRELAHLCKENVALLLVIHDLKAALDKPRSGGGDDELPVLRARVVLAP